MKKLEEKKEKVMGIIKKAGYGLYDTSYPCLYFTVYVSEGLASLQIMSGKRADNFIMSYGVSDVKDLNGKPVWVEHKDRMMINLKPCII